MFNETSWKRSDSEIAQVIYLAFVLNKQLVRVVVNDAIFSGTVEYRLGVIECRKRCEEKRWENPFRQVLLQRS